MWWYGVLWWCGVLWWLCGVPQAVTRNEETTCRVVITGGANAHNDANEMSLEPNTCFRSVRGCTASRPHYETISEWACSPSQPITI